MIFVSVNMKQHNTFGMIVSKFKIQDTETKLIRTPVTGANYEKLRDFQL